jgi:hypothetical protein
VVVAVIREAEEEEDSSVPEVVSAREEVEEAVLEAEGEEEAVEMREEVSLARDLLKCPASVIDITKAKGHETYNGDCREMPAMSAIQSMLERRTFIRGDE